LAVSKETAVMRIAYNEVFLKVLERIKREKLQYFNLEDFNDIIGTYLNLK